MRFKLNGLDKTVTIRGGDAHIQLTVSRPSYIDRLRISHMGMQDPAEGTRELIACTVVGWTDVQDQNGKPVLFSVDNLDRVMADNMELGDAIIEELSKVARLGRYEADGNGDDEDGGGEGSEADPTPKPASS